MFRVEYSKSARKALKGMPRGTARLIVEKVEALAANPHAPNNNVKKLRNHPGYRLRVGDLRVVYLLQEQVLLIAIVKIGSRGDVYQ
jgi:mRNA interferase RelE/StbE